MGDSGAARARMDLVRAESDAPPPPPPASLHRDAATVFPQRTAADVTKAVGHALAAAGALSFVSEADIQADRAALGGGGGGAGAGGPDPSKPLVEVLRATRAAKQEAFDAAWKEMKTGTNRPLEADEAAFLGELADARATADAAAAAAERIEVAAFQAAAARGAEARAKAKEAEGGGGVIAAAAAVAQPPPPPARQRLAAVVRKAKAKRARPATPPEIAAAPAAAGGGLAGLLGGYGSDESSE